MPVTLPPGRARLSSKPISTGSARPPIITIGIVVVAFLAACFEWASRYQK